LTEEITVNQNELGEKNIIPTKGTILIVDDSRVSRMMTAALIHDQRPNWQILEASQSDEALAIREKQAIDFFSIDYNMPGLNGLDLIKLIKTRCPNAKIVLFTANTQDSIHSQTRQLDAVCINKPITNQSIHQMLEYFS